MKIDKRLFKLQNKLGSVLNKNQGEVILVFQNGESIRAKVKASNVKYSIKSGVQGTITTFINDINKTTIYDLSEIEDIK